jgi:hypothetical protein
LDTCDVSISFENLPTSDFIVIFEERQLMEQHRDLIALFIPMLQELGYVYDSQVPSYPTHFSLGGQTCFVKPLRDGVYTMILLRWRTVKDSMQSPLSFTVRCVRIKPSSLDQWYQPDNPSDIASSIMTTLGQILWYQYHRRELPVAYYWWQVDARTNLAQTAHTIRDQLATFTLPWLEDPRTIILPATIEPPRRFFRELLHMQVAPVLAQYGYLITEDPGFYPYFARPIWDDFHAFIFLACGVTGEKQWNFDIFLGRGVSPEWTQPSSAKGYVSMPVTSLARLVPGLTDERVLHNQWVFHDRQTLSIQLQDASNMLTQYALPWLHDPTTQYP